MYVGVYQAAFNLRKSYLQKKECMHGLTEILPMQILE